MKNLFPLLIFLAFTTGLSAQIQKGSVLLGGTVGFTNISEDGDSYTQLSLAPTVGFFLSDRFALGGKLQFDLLAVDDATASTLGLAPFGRYYFNGSGMSRFFGQVDVGFLAGLGDTSDENQFLFGAGVGVDFLLKESVAIEAGLGYHRYQYTDGDFGYNNIGLNFGIVAFIGRNK